MALATDPAPAGDRELTIVRSFDAPPALLFKMWTQPEHIARWWGCPYCRSVSAKTDVRVGGAFQVDMDLEDGSLHTISGVYKEIREPDLLSFTWSWRRDDGTKGSDTVVTVEFAYRGDVTEMTLHQAVFGDPAECLGHNEGWTTSFDRLLRYIETA